MYPVLESRLRELDKFLAATKLNGYNQGTNDCHIRLFDCTSFSAKGFNFPDLNPSVDFYVVGFQNFNPCTDNLKNGGTVPFKGNNQNSLVSSQII